MIYLDYAAATPLDQAVARAMQPYLSRQFFNPSADYPEARAVREAIHSARRQVAHWLGAKPSEIIFTAGGSEANNLAIKGVMSNYPKAKALISEIEHDSILAPAANYPNAKVKVMPDGRVDLGTLERLIDDQTVLLSVMYANNEIGTIEPIRQIAAGVKRVRAERKLAGNPLPLLLHTDACQAANYLDLHVSRLGVDLMTLNGGKIYGPKQSGALYIRAGTVIKPLIEGGGQEFGLRSGTENVAASVGFSAALAQAQSERASESRRLSLLREHFSGLIRKEIKSASINGSIKYRLPNNLNVSFNGTDNETLLIKLSEHGILAAAGSACSASDLSPSHVLLALGLSESNARSALRFSLGRGTKSADIERTVKVLKTLVA